MTTEGLPVQLTKNDPYKTVVPNKTQTVLANSIDPCKALDRLHACPKRHRTVGPGNCAPLVLSIKYSSIENKALSLEDRPKIQPNWLETSLVGQNS